jgi:hypothetical protein
LLPADWLNATLSDLTRRHALPRRTCGAGLASQNGNFPMLRYTVLGLSSIANESGERHVALI